MNQDKFIAMLGERSLVEMDKEKDQLLVLYIDRENNSYHQVLLNSLELKKIGSEITQIFAAKKMDVMVSDRKLKLFEEVETNGKKNRREVQ